MKRSLIPDLEALNLDSSDEKEDVVRMNVPLMIRIFEYIREDVKEDVEIHDIAERLVKFSNESDKELTMDDYEAIVGTTTKEPISVASEEAMLASEVQKDDVFVCTDSGKHFINVTGSNESLDDWKEIVEEETHDLEEIEMVVDFKKIVEVDSDEAQFALEAANEMVIKRTDLDKYFVNTSGKNESSSDWEEGVLSTEAINNKTHSTIVINMENIDQANALTTALNNFSNKAGVGGDVEMFISTSDGEPKSCGTIGHDVKIGKIYHNVPDEKGGDKKEDKKDKDKKD